MELHVWQSALSFVLFARISVRRQENSRSWAEQSKKPKIFFVYEMATTQGELWELFYCFIIMIRQAATKQLNVNRHKFLMKNFGFIAVQVGINVPEWEKEISWKMTKQTRRDDNLNFCLINGTRVWIISCGKAWVLNFTLLLNLMDVDLKLWLSQ